MKKVIALLLCAVLIFSVMPFSALADDSEFKNAADNLHALGLFNGTGTNADGTPIYELDREPTRVEAITMLVGLLGKSEEAKAGSWSTPFADVPDWAKPYVGYAYFNGITKGISSTAFGSTDKISASQYLTFILTALGYESGKDFQWDKAWELSDRLGLTDGKYDSGSEFVRGDIAEISFNSLGTYRKDSTETLADKLILENVFTQEAYDSVADASAADSESFDLVSYLLSLNPDDIKENMAGGTQVHYFYNDRYIADEIAEVIYDNLGVTDGYDFGSGIQDAKWEFTGTRVEVNYDGIWVMVGNHYGPGLPGHRAEIRIK